MQFRDPNNIQYIVPYLRYYPPIESPVTEELDLDAAVGRTEVPETTLILAPGGCFFLSPFGFFADPTPPPSLLDRVFHRGWRIDIHDDVENILLVV